MRVRPLLIGATTLAVLAFAGPASAANTFAGPTSATNVTVWAGPGFLKAPPAGAPKTADANLFFPKRVVIHVGDTVTFKSQGFHTATYLGTHKASEFQVFIPDQGATYSGATDAAGSPFYFNGLQKFAYNVPQIFAPSGPKIITGGADVRNSGVLNKKGYTYRFTKPGDYTFRCLIHPMMTMHVVVKPRNEAVMSASAILKANAAELNAAVATAKALDKVAPQDANTVYAGVGKQVAGGSIELMTFKPQRLTVKVGSTVTFKVNSPMEPHNMVFGPEAYLKSSLKTLDLVPQAPGQPNQVWPFFFYGTDPAANGVYTFGGTRSHGNGFFSTALLGPTGTPLPNTLKITFTSPGTYKYICGLHGPDMNGEIVVTP